MLVRITGWIAGFPKVKFNRWLRAHAGFSIAIAKMNVDKILNGETVVVKIFNFSKVEIMNELTGMKIIFKIVEGTK